VKRKNLSLINTKNQLLKQKESVMYPVEDDVPTLQHLLVWRNGSATDL
jgi:uncharacterized protein YbaR (Trm112 family)